LIKGAESLGAVPRNGRRHALLSLACLTWYVFARLFLSRSVAFASSFAALAILLGIAGYSYLRLARHRRMLGAAIIGSVLVIIVSSNVVIAMSVPAMIRAEQMTLGLLMTNIICYSIVAAGMFVVVFEDMTVELRRTNHELQAAQRELTQQAITDALTGCYNRRHFDDVIRREMKRHGRFGIPMSVLFVDVDRFKQVNDSAGHQAGDRVLVQVAELLRRHTREFDLLFRWGGDEFLLLLSCGEADARAKAAQLKRAFAASLPANGHGAPLGLSIGVVEIQRNAAEILPLIAEADRLMYVDKVSN
jgi:diguanylate cyclase (GGDEF)-like protein